MKTLWQQIPSPIVTEILCKNNKFDGVVLDNEHGVFSNETLHHCIQIATLCKKKCFVRLTEPDKTLVRYCLDSGVDGLIFSTVETQEQAMEIIDQCLFPAQGGKRGYGLTRDCFWGEEQRKGGPMLIAQIETVDGVKWLKDRKFGVAVFDYFLIGPYDLSSSLGDPENFKSKAYRKCVDDIIDVAGKSKVGYHIVKDIEVHHEHLKDCGFLAYSLDTLMMIESIKKLQEIVNE
jgi:2-keto-3-deoxy-L-rhamnonate aldolase RhmA